MKALLLVDDETEKIQISEVDNPKIGPDQVLIQVKAAALNRRDQWIRQGMYPNIQFNTVLGSDGAGVVVEVGEAVENALLNQEVVINPNLNWGMDPKVQSSEYHIIGMPTNGTLAEYIAVDANRIHPKPEFLSWEEAAALPLGGLTAYRAVFGHGELKHNENVLISGVGGGVAQFAFLFSLATGANVYVTSGSKEKIDKCVELGASGGFNYKQEDWQKESLKLTGGFDLVIDSAGGDQLNDFIKMMKPAGRIVFYGATNGMPSKLDVFRMFWNQITLQGSTMGNDLEFEEMLGFVNDHQLKPIVDSVRPLDEAISAFDDMREGKQFGKLVLKI